MRRRSVFRSLRSSFRQIFVFKRYGCGVCFFRSKPRLCILADSDEESSSAGSSDEEEAPPSELLGSVGEKNPTVAAEG